ncbi:lactate/malate family dehydrogenase [Campylobacter mucosalis]|uniref:Malate dehydrogenase, NAD-dependent n=1 Tax=Campylobacter mucosalis CCUG 21559 TaxID=1032067 RepID=A0A6G5QHF3_9BACT|nr:malate dehydrogenase [Campylobacter mucosalis]QCD45062.1 malate dehydrogenase, NAD-dependent [Campylobacter mucosalis CCUG 21559]
MKISVIGAGNVGASVAYALALRGLCDELAIIDIFANHAKSKAMDIAQSTQVFNLPIKVNGGDDYTLVSKSDIVVMTAGSPRKPGQSREDLLLINAKVLKSVMENVKTYAPNAILIMVTNPLDVMVYLAQKFTGFKSSKIIGMAGELDSARLRYEISNLKGDADSKSMVVGAHNDKMIISKNYVKDALSDDEFKNISDDTKNGGAKFVELVGTSAFYAPAAGAVKLCEAIIKDKKELQSVSVILDGFACGRVASIAKDGICEIFELNLTQSEQEKLKESQEEIAKNIKFVEENL